MKSKVLSLASVLVVCLGLFSFTISDKTGQELENAKKVEGNLLSSTEKMNETRANNKMVLAVACISEHTAATDDLGLLLIDKIKIGLSKL